VDEVVCVVVVKCCGLLERSHKKCGCVKSAWSDETWKGCMWVIVVLVVLLWMVWW
jgi:hypothetical protein